MLDNTERARKYGQSRETDNIGHTRRSQAKQKQSRETENIGYTRRRQTKQKQSRETGNTGYTRRRKTKQKHNTICVGHHYMQTNTNNVNKTTGGKDEPNIVFMWKS
jgi:hypothetical protein